MLQDHPADQARKLPEPRGISLVERRRSLSSVTTSSEVVATLYSWPNLEPIRHAFYHPQHLQLPLRRDILHRAVIYEADASRQGTASTKWRGDVHGSNRKIIPQKGTGHARAGDKKSPIRRGGGVAFGPHPRDFSTDLQRKVYDLAWRTALSYRYRRGELIVLENKIGLPRGTGGRLLSNIFEGNQWGKGNGRSLLVTERLRERLFREMGEVGEHGLVKDIHDVDVKDVLETGRIIIEKHALDSLLYAHASDLGIGANIQRALKANKQHFLKHALPRRPPLPLRRPAMNQYAQVDGQGSDMEASSIGTADSQVLVDDGRSESAQERAQLHGY